MIWAQNCVKWLWRWCTSKFTKTSAGFDELWNKLLVYHWGRGKLRHMWVDMNEWKTLWCCHAWLTSRVVSYKYSSSRMSAGHYDYAMLPWLPTHSLEIESYSADGGRAQWHPKGNRGLLFFLRRKHSIFEGPISDHFVPKIFFPEAVCKKLVLNFYFWNIQTETLPMAQRNQRLRAFTKSNCF